MRDKHDSAYPVAIVQLPTTCPASNHLPSIQPPAQLVTTFPSSDKLHGCRQLQVDGAFKGSDQEAVDMAAWLLAKDGLFLGSSAAMNCVGAVKAARQLGPGKCRGRGGGSKSNRKIKV